MPAAFRRIGLYARAEIRLFMVEVARRLKEAHGASITLFAPNPQTIDLYRRLGSDVFDEFVEAKPIHAAALETPADDHVEIQRARAHEARIGRTINFLSVSNRHLGRGYALGGFHHPRSRASEQASYVNLLHAYNEVLDFWDREISSRRLTLVVNGPREAAIVARLHGVPYRVMAGSRHENFHYWAHDEYFANPDFATAYRALANTPVEPIRLDQSTSAHLQNREAFIERSGALALTKRGLRETARYAYWRLRGFEKARGYYLHENLNYFFRIWVDNRRLRKLATTRLADLAGRPFVFYPLHLEPETALQGLSPEYFFQLELIAAVARDLPAGVLLAVKEHVTAVGRRPTDFYKQIAEFKNVILLDSFEYGVECIKAAAATVTICGSAGFEAAVTGRPVVAIGRHNIYNGLPHVRSVAGIAELADALREALNDNLPSDRSRQDGARFLKSVVERSFDMRKYSYQKLDNFEPAAVQDACGSLAQSLPTAAVTSAA